MPGNRFLLGFDGAPLRLAEQKARNSVQVILGFDGAPLRLAEQKARNSVQVILGSTELRCVSPSKRLGTPYKRF